MELCCPLLSCTFPLVIRQCMPSAGNMLHFFVLTPVEQKC